MNGFRVMGRVLWSGTKQTGIQLWWWQAARDLTGRERVGTVAMRAVGTMCLTGFGGGFMWALGVLWYVLPLAWLVAVGVLADVAVEDTEPLPSPTDDPLFEEEDAGQDVVVERGRIGKAPVLRIHDPKDPARTHLVWLGKAPQKEAS